MSDVGFVIAAYGVILGGIGLYAALLMRRLRIAREARHGEAHATPHDDPR